MSWILGQSDEWAADAADPFVRPICPVCGEQCPSLAVHGDKYFEGGGAAKFGAHEGPAPRPCASCAREQDRAAAAAQKAAEEAASKAWVNARAQEELQAKNKFFACLQNFLRDRKVPENSFDGGPSVSIFEGTLYLEYRATPNSNPRSAYMAERGQLGNARKVVGGYSPVLDEVLSLVEKFWK